jgi:hypothetical protein
MKVVEPLSSSQRPTRKLASKLHELQLTRGRLCENEMRSEKLCMNVSYRNRCGSRRWELGKPQCVLSCQF